MKPLVSILIPNYHHSMYLDDCLQSVYNQTYSNIEVILLDNSSVDNSIETASKYISRGLRLCINPYNIYTNSYRILSEEFAAGDYLMLLPADDYIAPHFLEKCVDIMENNHDIGYVHTDRNFITEAGEVIEQEPFYNCSFAASGHDVMPIYMMTTVAHSAQAIYRRSVFGKVRGYNRYIDHANIDKALWFYLSSVCDYAYIAEPLANIRIGRSTETFLTQKNFQHPILMALTIMDFMQFANENSLQKVCDREQKAFEKLAVELLYACARILTTRDYENAIRYLVFCEILDERIVNNEVYKKLKNMADREAVDMVYLEELERQGLQHKRNYEPPDNYRELSTVCRKEG